MHCLPSVVSVESSSGKVRHIAIEKAAARTNTLNHMVVQRRIAFDIKFLTIECVLPRAGK